MLQDRRRALRDQRSDRLVGANRDWLILDDAEKLGHLRGRHGLGHIQGLENRLKMA